MVTVWALYLVPSLGFLICTMGIITKDCNKDEVQYIWCLALLSDSNTHFSLLPFYLRDINENIVLITEGIAK